MRNKIIVIGIVLISLALNVSAQTEFYSDFPGGNGIITKIKNDSIWVRPDLRDTEGNWFYWYFAMQKAKGEKLSFIFPKDCFCKAGVSVSKDRGMNWKWEQPEAFMNNGFVYRFNSDDEVRFSMGIPYTQKNWDSFINKYKNDSYVKFTYLAKTKKGRMAEMIDIRKPQSEPKLKVLITARHHACEMVASYAMEGLISYVLDDSWLRDNVEMLFVPFMDKDGVEDGDQGKNRRPRDHNRDYSQISVHETTAALRKYIPVWLEGKKNVMIDIHCPWIHSGNNDSIFLCGSSRKDMEIRQLHFSDLIKKNNKSELTYDPHGFIKYGSKDWTLPKYPEEGFSSTTWAADLENNELSVCIEVPYGVNGYQMVTADKMRSFGRDVAVALKDYLQEIGKK